MAQDVPGRVSDDVVTARGVRRVFGSDVVLDGIDLTLRRGEIVALVGRSGSGKSTLLRTVAGLDRGHEGRIAVDGSVAVAFQEPRLLPWKRVHRNVSLGLPDGDGKRRAIEALGEVNLGHRVDAWPLTLSGGEAQRVSLARALVREPDLLLLDEPFGALDALTRITAYELLIRLWRRHGFAVLLVTHDAEEAVLLADRVLVLDGGRIAHDVSVTAPRPRQRAHPEVVALRRQVLAHLGVLEGISA
ncbi:aliphatic sulfonate ABC transporter ATP-binding protein [Prescottella equi]|uniref:ABC transporter ATP-binding protein n=1 Tax=Rhodococcus hoagii TaxID=43767 RepID=UPI000A10A35E|nr:ABC transporter ATP-binding protein [Prescottella equi]ORL32299.1 aliphatic sulfonate ABC transporter ATP-binding protein [Prescottella equi]ORL91330.1 aliphatic sulfonate ABC transporter ATP-binding protein [Prescottella equi]ORM23220.1 aliphatic sulfonate ABC transporter ATP-binding protein [Prescottella equi]